MQQSDNSSNQSSEPKFKATVVYNKATFDNYYNYYQDYLKTMKQEQALRYNDGKAPLVFILDFPNAVEGLARVKEYGAQKYALHNWKKGRSFRDTLSSLLRHAYASQTEAYDPETGNPHVDHIMWNAMALAEWYRTHPELNDWGPNL